MGKCRIIYGKFYQQLLKNLQKFVENFTKINLFYKNVRIILRKLMENFKDFLKGP